MHSNRAHWLWASLCFALAGVMLLCGWLMPVHLRAVAEPVLQRAGEGRASLNDRAAELRRANNIGAARLLQEAAGIAGKANPASTPSAPSENVPLFPGGPMVSRSTPVMALMIGLENRQQLLAYLEGINLPVVREWLRNRDLTNTVLIPASSSASGQAFDAALSVGGLLLAGNDLTAGLRDAMVERSAFARTHADAQALEEILLDLMSLGQRLTWEQLTVFVRPIDGPGTLSLLADQARNAGSQLPVLYAAVVLPQEAAQVAAYLNDFSLTGLHDLGASLRYGEGGVRELLRRHQRLFTSSLLQRWSSAGPLFLRVATDWSLRAPRLALIVKWSAYSLAGLLLAAAGYFARATKAPSEQPARARVIYLVRGLLFALVLLLGMLLLSEPFLAQESQKATFAFRLRLPLAGAAAPSSTPTVKPKNMYTDTRSLLTLGLFFVLQALIYCACLLKLGEIRRLKSPPRLRLKLLENEEHLFDAGLYLGFAGTIVCLILVSLGIIQQSLMAAYSSTSFGIIFVSVFKIFNLRPFRRQLLLQADAEAQSAGPETVMGSGSSVASPV